MTQPELTTETLPFPSGTSTRPSESTLTVTQLSSSTPRRSSWMVASNLFVSFKYAWAGLDYAFRTQRNFRIHTALGSMAVLLSFFLNVSSVEVAIIALTIGAVLTMELVNTALESVVDLTVSQTYHELAKIAKDCAAGAVLVAAIAAVIVAGTILLPPLYQLAIATL
jgi:diacylglycerol kinase (ATP)